MYDSETLKFSTVSNLWQKKYDFLVFVADTTRALIG